MLAEVVAPSGCAACDAPVGAAVLFCPACAVSALPATSRDGPLAYGGAVAEAIVRMKFQGRADLAPRLARVMIPLARALPVDVVVPVPIHRQRLLERGYNQAALLARPIAGAIGRPLAARSLERVRDTPMQSSLDRAARLTNLAGAFRARSPKDVRDRAVLLVDDVRTTGSTLTACARSLHEVGARRVFSLVLACRDGLAL
ncbi:MAG: ComF family protein [Labilithrix sp.]|nr:ComF family protein [Labilithrix sp.]MCW5810561.1 ComF family protein [Labilithrix sp.]